MTREEAIKIWKRSGLSFDFRDVDDGTAANRAIDAFAALGMLKLEEPKTATNKFADILARYFPGPEVEEVWAAIEGANLIVVEK